MVVERKTWSKTLSELPTLSPGVGRRLGGVDSIIPAKIAISKRAWLRICDAGKAPWGLKLGGRRLWDLDELDEWIATGCKPVRSAKSSAK